MGVKLRDTQHSVRWRQEDEPSRAWDTIPLNDDNDDAQLYREICQRRGVPPGHFNQCVTEIVPPNNGGVLKMLLMDKLRMDFD